MLFFILRWLASCSKICVSSGGDRGTEAEAKCTGSYDTDGTAYSYRFRQCAVRVLSESRFNCLAATPCEAPEDWELGGWHDINGSDNWYACAKKNYDEDEVSVQP